GGAQRGLGHVRDPQRRAVAARPRGVRAGAGKRDDRDPPRWPRGGGFVVVDGGPALGLPSIFRDEWVWIDHPSGTKNRIGRVSDAVVIAVLALVVGPPVALLRLLVVPDVGAFGVIADRRVVADDVVVEDHVLFRVAEPDAPVDVRVDGVVGH